ncbi:winged helix-turn-helix transcriptional regulator [Barnesiella intestinihominis]|uniref:winged helix-turn-helix transcriptional regulator n=1 Tax=Barnesiella intestinihominis TaxID=487174 RepID=UPI00266C2F01|nr:helix-turn-helix domain-containing protein [Barnesiella intestinihominis]
MYERKIPVDLSCPLRLTMSLIDSKWKSCILDELRRRALRPSELHKLFPEATPRVLDLQLKELVRDGLVVKTIFPELPPRSEYALSELGQTLVPIIDALIAWGGKNAAVFERKYGKDGLGAGPQEG